MRKIVLGVTGIPGSGKSTFCRSLRVPIIDADSIGHALIDEPSMQKKFLKRWGPRIKNKDTSTLSRSAIANIVFSDEKERVFLNRVMHPAMKKQMKQIIAKSRAKILTIDAALLLEAKWNMLCDITLCVVANKKTIAARVKNKSAWARICAAQWSQDKKAKAADIIVDNNGAKQDLERIATLLIRTLKTLKN